MGFTNNLYHLLFRLTIGSGLIFTILMLLSAVLTAEARGRVSMLTETSLLTPTATLTSTPTWPTPTQPCSPNVTLEVIPARSWVTIASPAIVFGDGLMYMVSPTLLPSGQRHMKCICP